MRRRSPFQWISGSAVKPGLVHSILTTLVALGLTSVLVGLVASLIWNRTPEAEPGH